MWSHQEDDIKALEAVLDEGFHKEEGPFVKALDRALRHLMYKGRRTMLEHLLGTMFTELSK